MFGNLGSSGNLFLISVIGVDQWWFCFSDLGDVGA
jgi:hypothetical protein